VVSGCVHIQVIGMFIVQSVWRRSVDRIPVGARFSSPVQTGCGTYPASCRVGTGYLCRPGHGFDHPPLPTAEVKETVELNLYFRSGPSWSVLFPYGARSFKKHCTCRCGVWIYTHPDTTPTSTVQIYTNR
jgi:hypothetical protein